MNLKTLVASAFLALSTVNYQDLAFANQNLQLYAQAQVPAVSTQKDLNLERMLGVYRSLVFKQDFGKRAMQMALYFYNDVITESENKSYLSEAYLTSGILLCCRMDFTKIQDGKVVLYKKLDEGKKRLEKAYEIGGPEVKLEAAYWLGKLHFGYGRLGIGPFNLREAKEYLHEVRRNKESERAREAQTMLEQIELIELPKTK